MAIIRVDNVRIGELMSILATLIMDYDVVDILIDEEAKKVIIDPVAIRTGTLPAPTQLSDDTIKDII